jgi:alpha-tubulin suppressor-like RCC1 family protein
MKIIRFLLSLAFIAFLSDGLNAQVYYWVGGSGNWTDTLHWSNTSNGAPNAGVPPTANSTVIFDGKSFTANGQVVTVDTNNIKVKSILWQLDSTDLIGVPATVFYNPSFQGISTGDSIKVNGSFLLHPSMSFTFNGPVYFTGGTNDSIVSAGKTFGGDITIDTYGQNLKILGNLTTTGKFIYKRGGLNIDNIAISCQRFDSNTTGSKTLSADSTIFNLSGADTVLIIKPMTALNGTNRVFNINNSSTQNYLSIGMGGVAQNWGTLNLLNKNVRFISDSYFDTIKHVNSIQNIEILGGKKLKCNQFNIDGNCGKYINFKGISTTAIIENLSVWNIDYFKTQNLNRVSSLAINATNTINLGNTQNFTITQDNTLPIALYWIGGQGNFYDGQHWSFTSGGVASNCVPTPNDTVYFNAPSFNTVNDTLFVTEDIRVATANFTGLDVNIILSGVNAKFNLSKNLFGSGNLSFDWEGHFDMSGTTACTIQTGSGGNWGVTIYKSGSGSLTFLDNFNSSSNFYHYNGTLNTNGKTVSLLSFVSSHLTQTRNLNFLNSTFNVKGSEFTVNSSNLTTYHTSGTTFNFIADSLLTVFTPGTDSLYAVNVKNGTSVQVEATSVKYYSILDVDAGSTLILKNSSTHEFNSLSAIGTCDSLITIKSYNTNYGPATLGHLSTWSNNLNVNYALIDNVTAGLGSPYYVNNSIISPASVNWNSGTALVTVSVGFLLAAPNDTISQGETTPSIPSATNLVIPAGATITSSVLTLNGVQTTGSTTLDECRVSTSGASTLAEIALTPPTVSTIQINTTTAAGANGLVNLVLKQVAGPAGNFIVDTAYLTVSYFIPYVPIEDTLYWYGGTGDWSDLGHWSYNSGNIPASPATCIPSLGDHVVFDALSFSADDQSVTVDNTSYFASMTWSTIDDSVSLRMTEDLTANEDVTWSPLLSINKGSGSGKFKFQPNNTTAFLNQNSANVDVNIEYISFDLNDTLSLSSDFDNGNFNSFIVYGGVFNTNNHSIHSNAFLITSAFTPKKVNLGSSVLDLIAGYADYAGSSTTLNAGTSFIHVNHSDLVSTNYFRGNGKTYNRVQLDFNSNNYSVFSGSNIFDSLIVGAGSKMTIDSLSNNTINSGFIMHGTCQDSIYLKSSGSSNYTFTSSAVLDAMCLNVKNSTATTVVPGSFITYFSTNAAGNSGAWNFNTTPSTTAIIDTVFNFCFGDTVNFSNSSTAFMNDVANLNYTWSFGDGETFMGDTTLHYYNFPGQYVLKLTSTYSNLCKSTFIDTIEIFAPSVSLTSSINDTLMCAEEMISFFASTSASGATQSLFEFVINGASANTPTLNFTQLDTLNLPNPSYIYVNLTENGCQVASDSIKMNVIPLDTITLSVPNTTICAGQSVTLTPSGSNLYKYYKNGVAITPFTSLPYTTSSIANGDIFYVIGKNSSTLCSDTSNTLTFTVNALPTITSFVSSDANNIICANDTVIFTVTSPTAVSYHYYVNSVLYADTTLTPFGITNIPSGGQVNVVVENVAGCLSAPSSTITHLVNPVPNITLTSTSPSNSICDGTSVLFSATNGNLYQYYLNGNPIGTLSTNAFYETDSLNNNDQITVLGSTFGCTDKSDTLIFSVINTPTTTLTSNIGTTICQGQTAVLTANSSIATNFEFYKNGTLLYNGPLNTYSTSTLVNGDLITVVGSASGCSSTANLTFTVNANPNPSIFTNDANNIICQGQSITITGNGGNSYEYFVNGVSAFTGATPYTTATLPSGINSIYIVATNTVTGCASTTDTISVNSIQLPVTNLIVSTNPICMGESVTFTASSAVADNYQFFVNSVSQGLPSSSPTFTSTTLTNGAIVFVKAYNDGCPNLGLDTITMVVNANPIATMTGSAVFCQNTAQVYTGSSSIAGSSFEFFVNGNSQSASSTYNASGLTNGNYNLELVVTSPNGCTDNVLSNISVLENPIVALNGDASICSGETVTFNGSGALNYQFFVNGIPTATTSTFTTSSLNNGDVVTLSGSTGAGCTSTSATQITMAVTPVPSISLISDDADNILCSGNTVNFTASGGTTYEFFVNGISQGPSSTNPIFTTSTLSNGQTVSVQGQSNGCIDYSTPGIVFSVSNSPVVSLANLEDTVLCSDTPTQLVAGGASSYLFFVNGNPQGGFTPSNTLNILLNDGDVVTVQGMTNTCISNANAAFEFSVFTYPTTSLISSDPDNTICYGDAVVFTGSGAMEYEYFIDGLSQGITGPIYSTDQLLNGQVISLIGYNSECATNAPQTLLFTVNTLDLSTTVNPSDFMVCGGTTFDLQASGADEYEIFVNNISQGPQSTNSNFSLNNLNDGDIITLNGYSTTTGCTQSDDQTIFVQVFQEPTITNNGPTTFCEGDSVILYSNNSTGNQWYLNGTAIAGENDSVLVVYSSGNYSLETTHGGNGELWSVGYNANGEFGDSSNINNMYPSLAQTITDITAISSGINHTMVMNSAGQLYLSGDNSSGQLGNGTYTASNTPILLTTVPTIAGVAAGENSSLVVTTTGELFSWGDNNEGQLGLGNTTVFNTPQWLVGMSGFTKVAAGKTHFMALKNDGTVWTVGNNDFGQLGNGTISSSSVFVQIPGLSNIVKINAGDYHSMAIDNNGSLYIWGNNSSGQLGLNDLNNRTIPTLSGLSNVKSVAGGNAHTLIVTNNNRAYSTGANNFGQLGTGDFVSHDSPIYLSDIDAVSEVAAGRHHSLFLKNDGTVWGAGRNDNKQLGNLVPTSIPTISRIENVDGVTIIDGGNQSSHFIYGNSTTCISSVETITVNNAPLPVISYNGNTLNSSTVGDSYEWFINDIPVVNSNSQNIIPTANGNYTVSVTYSNGCTRTSEIFTYPTVGIEEMDLSTLHLSPNPTNGEVKIQWNSDIQIENITLFDVTGKLLNEFTIQNSQSEFTFDLSNYANGIYSLRIKTVNGSGKSMRVIKN